ncbi:MAG: indole-3-glycerol phosphate synthase TrpC [bacterium]
MKTHGSILDEIVAHKKQNVDERALALPLNKVQSMLKSASPVRDFLKALRRTSGEPVRVLAEIKAASPSRGTIRAGIDPGAIARAYESAGASALSVLTDQRYFAGFDNHLIEARTATSLPTLRKDFTIDEYQIYEARSLGADAILLMAQILEQHEIERFLDLTHRLGMVALVEGHDHDEIDTILRSGARLVGVNNRDFRTMTTDIQTTLRLRDRILPDRILVSQSGITEAGQVKQLSEARVDAIQVGTSLMEGDDPVGKLASLLNG